MKVAELSDGEAFQPRRPTPKEDFLANDSRTVGLEQSGFGSKRTDAGGGCETDKVSSGRWKKKQSVRALCRGIGVHTVSTSRITRVPGFAIQPGGQYAEINVRVRN